MRTKRARRCHNVLFQRSMCAVCPDSFPHAVCGSSGKTFWYASQKSEKPCPRRNAAGMRSQSGWQVAAERSPVTSATTWRVCRHRAIQTQHLLAFFKTNDHNSSNSKSGFSAGTTNVMAKSGSGFFFALPLGHTVTRHAKGTRQATQGTPFFLGTQNFLALLLRITVRLQVFPTTTLTVVTKIPLLLIFRQAVLHEHIAPTVGASNQLSNHAGERSISPPLEPLPYLLIKKKSYSI